MDEMTPKGDSDMAEILTKERIRAVALGVVERAPHLSQALMRDDGTGYSGGNLVALLQVFAAELDKERDDLVRIIDARMGDGWTRQLAESLSNAPA